MADTDGRKVIASKELAKRIMVVPADVNSWTDKDNKEYDKAALTAAGFKTSDLVAVPFFSTDDMATPDSFAAALPRVIAEWAKAKQFTHVKTTSADAIAANGGSDEIRLADATLGENPVIFIADGMKSGVRLGHQTEMGTAMRKAIQEKLGSPKAKGTGRKRDIDA